MKMTFDKPESKRKNCERGVSGRFFLPPQCAAGSTAAFAGAAGRHPPDCGSSASETL